MFNFERLVVWQKSVIFVDQIFKHTQTFPRSELFGITSQLRRSTLSVPSNVAEGAGRKSKKEFAHFISIAYGSLCEVITLLKICLNREYINESEYNKLYCDAEEIARMLSGLSKL